MEEQRLEPPGAPGVCAGGVGRYPAGLSQGPMGDHSTLCGRYWSRAVAKSCNSPGFVTLSPRRRICFPPLAPGKCPLPRFCPDPGGLTFRCNLVRCRWILLPWPERGDTDYDTGKRPLNSWTALPGDRRDLRLLLRDPGPRHGAAQPPDSVHLQRPRLRPGVGSTMDILGNSRELDDDALKTDFVNLYATTPSGKQIKSSTFHLIGRTTTWPWASTLTSPPDLRQPDSAGSDERRVGFAVRHVAGRGGPAGGSV